MTIARTLKVSTLDHPNLEVVFDARSVLEVDDGTLIYMQNRGLLWGLQPDTMQRLHHWEFEDRLIA